MTTATDLSDRLEQASNRFADYLSSLSHEQWLTRCGNHPTIRVGDEDENRPVGTVAHHVAVAIPRMAGMVRTMVAGQEVQRPSSERNAAHAQANPDPDQAETVALLRRNAGEAAQMVRGLSEADLSRTGRTMLGEISAADAVARALVGHVTWHEGSIRATLGH
jgi:DinB superfamily